MQLRVYSIRDAKTETFSNPFYNHTHGEAERNFKTAINDDKTKLGQYPEDFDLYYLGKYDDNEGKFDMLESPEHLVKAVQLKDKGPIPVQ